MKVTQGLPHSQSQQSPALTIGNFDGQHLGHLALVAAVVETARRTGGVPMVLTFDPHPAQVLIPGVDLRLLTPFEEKLAWFQHVGVEEVVVLEFNEAFAALTPEAFVFNILQNGIGVRDVLVGEHFVFGNGRTGKIADLTRLGPQANFQVQTVPPVKVGGEVVSSTRIRKLIWHGSVREAAQCLGRPYRLSGRVVQGEQRGEELGWPTANLPLPAGRALPADGVYVTRTVWNERTFESVSYIGCRPTFIEGDRLLEVHFLDVKLPLYGEEIHVDFIERLRGDQTFRTSDELAVQIDLDVRLAREVLKTATCFTQQEDEMTVPMKSTACKP